MISNSYQNLDALFTFFKFLLGPTKGHNFNERGLMISHQTKLQID